MYWYLTPCFTELERRGEGFVIPQNIYKWLIQNEMTEEKMIMVTGATELHNDNYIPNMKTYFAM